MLSSFYISCFSSNGCPLGFYALLVLTFQRNALPPSSIDLIGPGRWWSDKVEKPTTFCNQTTSAATWTNSDMLKMEAIFSSKTVKQSSPRGVKTQMKTLIYVFTMANVIQHWAFHPNLDLVTIRFAACISTISKKSSSALTYDDLTWGTTDMIVRLVTKWDGTHFSVCTSMVSECGEHKLKWKSSFLLPITGCKGFASLN